MTPSHPALPRSFRVLSCLLLSLAAWAGPAAAQTMVGASHDPRGRWITANGNLEVEIAACGHALCGTVTQVMGQRSMSGAGEMKPVDARPALGMRLLTGFVPDRVDAKNLPVRWTGEIYNRENGKTYDCDLSVDTAGNPAGELVLRGYVGLRVFGQTQRWQRASEAPAPSADAR